MKGLGFNTVIYYIYVSTKLSLLNIYLVDSELDPNSEPHHLLVVATWKTFLILK